MAHQTDFRLHEKLEFQVAHRELKFRKPAITSRDTLLHRDVWYITVRDENGNCGVGECAPIFGLSTETRSEILNAIKAFQSTDLKRILQYYTNSSAIRMALETALSDLQNNGVKKPFHSADQWQIEINGLVWMNEKQQMLDEALRKIQSGFRCIKLKIGGIHFHDECEILNEIRNNYDSKKVEIRLDANGSFSPDEALQKLETLSAFDIHSIEQPIKPNQHEALRQIVKLSPIAIALDEELIGIHNNTEKLKILDSIAPPFIVLKPSLMGGFANCNEWIQLAEERKIKWWATSALESNIGLNAIARWVLGKNNKLPQGLGTGDLYTNNIESPMHSAGGYLHGIDGKSWGNING